jgi:Rhodopirellula transposase DDE domain
VRREKQFEHIERQKQCFESANWPIISVDTEKKELIGNFKDAGQAWGQQCLPSPHVETATAGAAERPLWFNGRGLELTNRLLQVEPD